jgi:hypothetical protein
MATIKRRVKKQTAAKSATIAAVTKWAKSQPWFTRDPEMTTFAIVVHGALNEDKPHLSIEKNLELVLKATKRKFPKRFKQPAEKALPSLPPLPPLPEGVLVPFDEFVAQGAIFAERYGQDAAIYLSEFITGMGQLYLHAGGDLGSGNFEPGLRVILADRLPEDAPLDTEVVITFAKKIAPGLFRPPAN